MCLLPTLTILGGDFNWVPADEDRRSASSAIASGIRDKREETHFQNIICKPYALHEMHQTEMTHASANARSRLDRIYCNEHVVEQIDREIKSVALEWKTHISNHRTVLFSRRAPHRLLEQDRGLQRDVIYHEDFTRQVHLSFQEKRRQQPMAAGIRVLKLLKEAIKETGQHLSSASGSLQAAVEMEDRLGVTMRFLRAAEQGAPGSVSTCLLRYPALRELVDNPYELGGNATLRLQRVRDHAVALAREHAINELGKAKQEEQKENSDRASRARKKATRLLYRLMPGRCSAVRAIIDKAGTHLTTPAEMAGALGEHWQQVFKARGIDHELLQQWLVEDAAERNQIGPHHSSLLSLQLEKRHIAKAIQQSNTSAPGPDGIPYAAWRQLGDLAVDVLYEAFQDFSGDDFEVKMTSEYPDFNESLLVFLPKKAVGTTAQGDAIFEPGGVRPLNITNADNRLLASACRILLEPMLGPLITEDQRGFIQGRSMLANLIDIDEVMLQTAAQDEGGVAFFFDFAAAFPSIEHQLLMSFFAHLGWPSWLMNFLNSLYRDNYCHLSLAGARYPGFRITRGVRQGCPISPLLFAACSDLFLRRLRRLFPRSTCRAYADDLALVLPDARRHFGILQSCFTQFERISGLGLNIPKTVLIPLDPYEDAEVRAAVGAGAPGWGGLVIATAAKYLGFYVGPGRGELSWKTPMEKFLDRATCFNCAGLSYFARELSIGSRSTSSNTMFWAFILHNFARALCFHVLFYNVLDDSLISR